MSCNRAARRIIKLGPPSRLSCIIACSRTVMECSYTSLWWWCSSTSRRSFGISGITMSAKPVSTKIVIPTRGSGDMRIFINSSRTRSAETIVIRSAKSFIDTRTLGSISKSNWLANRAARIMRSGSSLNESPGRPGVLKTFFDKSCKPLNGSRNSGASPVSSSAIAFTVKSRRDKSPRISFPYSTSGLRESEP